MTRAIWKLKKKFIILKTIKNCWTGDIVIKEEHLNKNFKLYTGRKSFLLTVTEDKLNRKTGEFLRRRHFIEHAKKKKKK